MRDILLGRCILSNARVIFKTGLGRGDLFVRHPRRGSKPQSASPELIQLRKSHWPVTAYYRHMQGHGGQRRQRDQCNYRLQVGGGSERKPNRVVFLAFTPLGASNKAVKQGTLVVWLPNQSISSTEQKKEGKKTLHARMNPCSIF